VCGVQVCIEEVGRGTEGDVICDASAGALQQTKTTMELTRVEVQNLPERALHDGEPLDLPVLVIISCTSRSALTTSTHLPRARLLLDSDSLPNSRAQPLDLPSLAMILQLSFVMKQFHAPFLSAQTR
jgi:hypothetical protein